MAVSQIDVTIRNVEIKALVRSPSASQAVNRKDRE